MSKFKKIMSRIKKKHNDMAYAIALLESMDKNRLVNFTNGNHRPQVVRFAVNILEASR